MLLVAGCESVTPDPATVVSVAGTWDGSWTNLDYLLSTAGGASPGRVQMILEQRGRLVTGTLTSLGLRATRRLQRASPRRARKRNARCGRARAAVGIAPPAPCARSA
jgi:hypothetical protein